MNPTCPHDPVGHIPCPDIEDLPPNLVLLLQTSLAQLELMRASIDRLGLQVERSQCAVCESEELLDRLRKAGL
jgi:hypothetical protein